MGNGIPGSIKPGQLFHQIQSGLKSARVTESKPERQSPSGNAATTSLSKSLNQDARMMQVQLRRMNEGFAVIAVADGALRQIDKVLARMQELANQSSDGVYSTTQRSALQNEFSALGSEVQRLAVNTQYKGVDLIDGGEVVGGVNRKRFAVELPLFSGVNGTLQSLQLSKAEGRGLSYSISANNIASAQSASRLASDAIDSARTLLRNERGELKAARERLADAIHEIRHKRHHPIGKEKGDADNFVAVDEKNAQDIAKNLGVHFGAEPKEAIDAQAGALSIDRVKALLED